MKNSGSIIASEIINEWRKESYFKELYKRKKERERVINMNYIIMCGGKYDTFKKPKSLSVINGETLLERTIRLLRKNGIENIAISATDKIFDNYGVLRLEHNNTFKVENGKVEGYWIDAYYPTEKPVIYLHGDVYYSESAIKKIIELNPKVNTFIGNEIARNPEHKNWGEPFGWIIVDQNKFRKAIEETKKLQDEGKLERGYALSWELYRVMNGTDPNYMLIDDDNYLSIDDETIDIDSPWQIEKLDEKIRGLNNDRM